MSQPLPESLQAQIAKRLDQIAPFLATDERVVITGTGRLRYAGYVTDGRRKKNCWIFITNQRVLALRARRLRPYHSVDLGSILAITRTGPTVAISTAGNTTSLKIDPAYTAAMFEDTVRAEIRQANE